MKLILPGLTILFFTLYLISIAITNNYEHNIMLLLFVIFSILSGIELLILIATGEI